MADIILHSHESWDGTGYPNKIGGEHIPVESRIIHIIGDYTYWTVPTISGGNYSRDTVVRKMKEQAGIVYDPELMGKFFDFLENYEQSLEE